MTEENRNYNRPLRHSAPTLSGVTELYWHEPPVYETILHVFYLHNLK